MTSDLLRSRRFAIFAIVITAMIIAWMHSIKADVGGYNMVHIFLSLFLFQDYPAAALTLVVLVLALVPTLQRHCVPVLQWVGANPWSLAALTFVTLAVLSKVVYLAHPLAMDEYAAVFQSQVFAAGEIYGHLPPDMIDALVVKGFQGHFLQASHATGNVASMYWPGFALVLAPFTWLGFTWLANPLLGAITVVLVHRIVQRLTGSVEAAGFAALLTVASPAVTVNSISLYSMPAHLAFNAAFVLLLIEPTFARALLAGFIGSIALVLHNPVPHALVAAPWLTWLIARSDRARTVPGLALGYAPLCFLLGFGWPHALGEIRDAATTATTVAPHPTSLADSALQHVTAGLHVFRFPTLDLLEDRIIGLAKLWLWAVPGLLLLSIAGAWACRRDTRCRLLAWSAGLTVVGFLFVPADQGHGWGFRYFHGAWFALPVLAALAVWPAQNHGGPLRTVASREGRSGAALVGYFAACAVLSLTLLTGQRMYQVREFMSRHIGQIPVVASGTARLVVVDWRRGYYSVDLVQNDPFLRTHPVMIVSQTPEIDAAVRARMCAGCKLLASSEVAQVWGYLPY